MNFTLQNKSYLRMIFQSLLLAVVGFFLGHFIFIKFLPSHHAPPPLNPIAPSSSHSTTDPTTSPPLISKVSSPAETILSSRGEKMLSYLEHTKTFSSDDFANLMENGFSNLSLQDALKKEWARRYPALMFEHLILNGSINDNGKRVDYRLALSEWTKQDPTAAITRLREISETSNSLPHSILHEMLKQNGHFGLALEQESHSNMTWWSSGHPKHFTQWYDDHKETALEKVLRVSNPKLRQSYLRTIAQITAGHDPENAFKQTASFNKEDQLAWVSGIVSELSKESYSEAIALLEEHIKDPIVLGAAAPAIKKWLLDDPAAAISWTDQHIVGENRTKIIAEAIRNIASKDWEKAYGVASNFQPGPTKNLAFDELFQSRLSMHGKTNPEKLTHWISEIDDPAAVSHMLDQNDYRIVDQCFPCARFLAEQDDSTFARRSLILKVAEKIRRDDPAAATHWIASLPERNRKIAQAGY